MMNANKFFYGLSMLLPLGVAVLDMNKIDLFEGAILIGMSASLCLFIYMMQKMDDTYWEVIQKQEKFWKDKGL